MESIIDRRRWEAKHRDAGFLGEPSSFLEEILPLVPRGAALDLACGLGANALRLAADGFEVDAFDWSTEGLRKLLAAAKLRDLEIRAVACDVTRFPLPRARYALVTSIRFLDRTLWPSLVAALKPGGALVVETFTLRYRERRPDFPKEYCLSEGELLSVFGASLRVALYREIPTESTAALLAFR
jgi:SAM-dependent methyltransferase